MRRPAGGFLSCPCFSILSRQMSFGCLWGAAPHRPTQATYLEVLTTPQPLLLEPLPTIHEHVVAGIPEARHEVVALSVGVHFKLRHGGLHLRGLGRKRSQGLDVGPHQPPLPFLCPTLQAPACQ